MNDIYHMPHETENIGNRYLKLWDAKNGLHIINPDPITNLYDYPITGN